MLCFRSYLKSQIKCRSEDFTLILSRISTNYIQGDQEDEKIKLRVGKELEIKER
jgi:hypothetical protein